VALEQEVKLPFSDVEAAEQAVKSAGGRLLHARRLIDDRLFDDEQNWLRERGCALRLRQDGERAFITWKGPAASGAAVKSREELETEVKNAETVFAIVSNLRYSQRFRSQKYRTEYEIQNALVTVDETPIGVFVEIEGTPSLIATVAQALGRSSADYVLDSYPSLWRQWCERHHRPFGDMLF
jgi:adenylate cyclase, class 2